MIPFLFECDEADNSTWVCLAPNQICDGNAECVNDWDEGVEVCGKSEYIDQRRLTSFNHYIIFK